MSKLIAGDEGMIDSLTREFQQLFQQRPSMERFRNFFISAFKDHSSSNSKLYLYIVLISVVDRLLIKTA